METIKDILSFCNAAISYDYTNIGVTCELYQVRKGIMNAFYTTIPHTRFPVSLSIFDDIILKINNNDIEDILENIDHLGENILYMPSIEKLIRDEQQKVIEPFFKDDE